jgi:hypothetical protein
MYAAEKLTAGVTDVIMTMNSYDYRLAVGERPLKGLSILTASASIFLGFPL